MVALERSLMRVRWFGLLLGTYLIIFYTPGDGSELPRSAKPSALVVLTCLVLLNGALMIFLRKPPSEASLRRVGVAVFAADAAALWADTWIFSFEEFGATWVILYILTLEGALRYRMKGALAPVLAGVVIEPLRDLYRLWAFDYRFDISAPIFRVGIMAIIAWVAGTMARGLHQERSQAEGRAEMLEELADREASLRRELGAFHQVLLIGVQTGQEMRDALQRMTEQIGRDFGYGSLYVLLLGDDGRLRPVTAYGLHPRVMQQSVAVGEGICGSVAETGKSELIEDVSADPRYYEVDPSTRSEIAVPILVHERVSGVLSAESPEPARFGLDDLPRLERLAAQMAVVIENARLLAQERAAVERLKELDNMKSDFIAITSHELRTPLTAMQGFIKTLRRPDLAIEPSELQEFLAILDRQSDRLARLVEDLLVVSRIDAGALRLQMDTVRIGELLQDMTEEVGPRADRIELAVDPSLPPMVTDGQRIFQIARNLVENGLKFAPEGTPVRVTALRDGSHLRIEVSDAGPGIPPQELARIFDRFHQVGGSMRRRGEGFGLGLYITKKLVEVLGGAIDVQSTTDRGTTFTVRLPLAAADEVAGSA